MRDGDTEFQGIDPVRARQFADDLDVEGATLEAAAVAIERIGVEGMFDAAPAIAAQCRRARACVLEGTRLLRKKSDEVEALERSWSRQPARVRPVGTVGYVPLVGGVLGTAGYGPSAAAQGAAAPTGLAGLSGSVADSALRAGWVSADQLLVVPSQFQAEVASPVSVSFAARAGGVRGAADRPPSGANGGALGPVNWAGLTAEDIARAERLVADLKKRPRPAADLSEEELLGVGVYLWDRQHTLDAKLVPELNDVDDVYYALLTPRDQGRIRSVVMLLDAQAYERVDALKSPHANELMQYLLSRERFGDDLGEVAKFAKEKFGMNRPGFCITS